MVDVTDRETNLEQARLQISQRIRQITEDPKPNYTIDGQTIAWADYLESLLEADKKLGDKLAAGDGTPWSEEIELYLP